MIGVYGVLAYTVAQSRHDIGIRIALGAEQGQIVRFFLGQGVRWVAIGGCVGLIAAVALVRFMRSMLFEVSAYDPGYSRLLGSAYRSPYANRSNLRRSRT